MEIIEKHHRKKTFIVFHLITDIENPEKDSPDCKVGRDLKIGTPSHRTVVLSLCRTKLDNRTFLRLSLTCTCPRCSLEQIPLE